MSSFDKYLGSYERVSPQRGEWLRRVERWKKDPKKYDEFKKAHPPPKKPNENPFIEVTAESNPVLSEVIAEECAFRGIPQPKCFINKGIEGLGKANPSLYQVYIHPDSCEIFDKKELRALVAHEVKHLYQGKAGDVKLFDKKELQEGGLQGMARFYKINMMRRERHLQAEFDSDRAALESTDLETMESFIHKSVNWMIDRKVPVKLFREALHRFHDEYPQVIVEAVRFPIDRYHPSPADRYSSVKDHAKHLHEQAGQGQNER